MPDTSELLPTTGQPEGSSVPKSTGTKPPEQPISPGVQRIIDGIRNGGQGAPREVLEEIAGEKPAPKKIIDMVKGPDGKLRAIVTSEPENPAATDANPQAAAEPKGQQRPRDRWREAEQPDQRKETQKQQELQRLQADGSRLAALVYSPEGQQLIAAMRTRLTQIVEVTLRKPKLENVDSFQHYQPAIAEVIQRNDQLLQVWQQSKETRVDSLLRGEGMTSSEIDTYLTSVLGHEPGHTTGYDSDPTKREREGRLVEQFDRTRRDIGRALLYQSSEAKPVGERYLLLSEGTLKWHGISTSEAQENFGKGWDQVRLGVNLKGENTRVETEQKPEILWRAFTVDPRTLTVYTFSQVLIPGTSVEDGIEKGNGNEYGVYMSTNRRMVETAYSSKGLPVPAPRFNDNGSIVDWVTLPQCGVIVEVDTKGLSIRKPKMTSALRGVHNNGFEGDEYIADEVPAQNYKVVRLILSRAANDADQISIDVEGSNEEQIQQAIEKVQKGFQLREQQAKEYIAFLNTLDPGQRLNDWIVKSKWQQYLEAKKPALVSNRAQGSESNGGGTNQPGVTGGLSILPDIDEVSPRPAVQSQLASEQSRQLDPIALLDMESMPLDEFFSLDRYQVYAGLHSLQSLPHGNPAREKALKILLLLEEGKERFSKENPGLEQVNFV